ncbi:hypothetical protein A7K91_01635 [Paenibacillus oryzae]|uniref:SLH domain-containing protein n=1 Tax=Paenibacillus oryzae TaxID=1844972 RepID=A0A1A5Y9P2_9BACL|nr:immunoglobulin-like domain-containing protein [Paenibacillus oryzae]OBR62346.1 hypothetical protein A7K91_01635 [Paenibacillus oryzae]
MKQNESGKRHVRNLFKRTLLAAMAMLIVVSGLALTPKRVDASAAGGWSYSGFTNSQMNNMSSARVIQGNNGKSYAVLVFSNNAQLYEYTGSGRWTYTVGWNTEGNNRTFSGVDVVVEDGYIYGATYTYNSQTTQDRQINVYKYNLLARTQTKLGNSIPGYYLNELYQLIVNNGEVILLDTYGQNSRESRYNSSTNSWSTVQMTSLTSAPIVTGERIINAGVLNGTAYAVYYRTNGANLPSYQFFMLEDGLWQKKMLEEEGSGIPNSGNYRLISLSQFDEKLYATVTDGGVLSLYQYDGTVWEQVGGSLVKENASFFVNNGEIYSTYMDRISSVRRIVAARWTGSAWVELPLGPVQPSGNPIPRLYSSNGELHLSILNTSSSATYVLYDYTLDEKPPVAVAFSPSPGAAGVPVDTDLTIQFNEMVTRGSAKIDIVRQEDGEIVETFTGNDLPSTAFQSVTLNPVKNLDYETSYEVHISPGTVIDGVSLPYEGISDDSWSFTTGTLAGPLLAAAYNPANNKQDQPVDAALSLSFNKNVQAVAGKAIKIVTANGTPVYSFDAGDTSNISVSGKTATINVDTLAYNSAYYVTIEAGAFVDAAGTAFAGISAANVWGFRTELEPAAKPSANPSSGELQKGGKVALSTTTDGASIYYTTDGSDPAESGLLYSTPIVVREAATILAIARKSGMKDSAAMSEAYTIAPLSPAPAFDPGFDPEPGNNPGDTEVTGPSAGASNKLMVVVSSTRIATPSLGDAAPSNPTIDPYVSGHPIPGVDPVVNRYIGIYEIDGDGGVVRFQLIVLEFEDVTPKPAPGFEPVFDPRPGDNPGDTEIPGPSAGAGNKLVAVVSSRIIPTPDMGDDGPASPTIDPYIAGDAISGADPVVYRYIGLYEVNGDGKVVRFQLIVLDAEDVNPEPTEFPVPVPTPYPLCYPMPGPKPGEAEIMIPELIAGHKHVVVVANRMIETPNVGDSGPSNPTIDPYVSGDPIPGVDSIVYRYIGLYELNANGKVVSFQLIVLGDADVNPNPDPGPVPGFQPKPRPEPGAEPDTTVFPAPVPVEPGNRAVVKVSSSAIPTPLIGDDFTPEAGMLDPYTGGDIPGVDPAVNRFIGIYEVNGNGKIVKFTLIVLNPDEIKDDDDGGGGTGGEEQGVPGFVPAPLPGPGTDPGTTNVPVPSVNPDNRMLVKVSNEVIATPRTGEAAPAGDGVIDPYAGGDIPGVDPVVNRYIGIYEVDASDTVIRFTLIVLNPDEVRKGNSGGGEEVPAPVFNPPFAPHPGDNPGETKLSGPDAGAGNKLVAVVSDTVIATPNIGDNGPANPTIDPYVAGEPIPGVDPAGKRYIGIYELDGDGKVVAFQLIVLEDGDVKPYPTPDPVPGFQPKPRPEPGADPDTTVFPVPVPVELGNRAVVKVSSAAIPTPLIGDDFTPEAGMLDPYTGGDIPGVDPAVNRFIGIYEVNGNGKIMKFTLIVLNPDEIKGDNDGGGGNGGEEEGVPGFVPAPLPGPGTDPGTTNVPVPSVSPDNRVLVKVSNEVIATPRTGEAAPAGDGVIDPYAGGDIPGVDPVVNRYIGIYEVDASDTVIRFTLIVLNPDEIRKGNSGGGEEVPAPVFNPPFAPHPGDNPGETKLSGPDAGAGNKLVAVVSDTVIATPNIGDNGPANPTIDPYVAGEPIPGVDSVKNRYIGVYELDSEGKVVAFQLIELKAEDISSDSDDLQKDLDQLAIVYSAGDYAEHVTQAMYFPRKGASGHTTVEWTSSIPANVSATGRVVRPEANQADAVVTLTAIITDTRTGETLTKIFVVQVLKMAGNDEEDVKEAGKHLTIDTAFSFAPGDTWESVTTRFLMLTEGLNGTSIRWTSSKANVITVSSEGEEAKGNVTRPEKRDEHVILTATISKGNASITKTFLMVVKNLSVSKEEAATRQVSGRQATLTSVPEGSENVERSTIYRTTLSDGTEIDTIIVGAASMKALTESMNPLAPEAERTVVIEIRQAAAGNKADEFAVELSYEAIQALADRNGKLEIATDEGSVILSSEAIRNSGSSASDLFFRIVPVKEATEQSEAQAKLGADRLVVQAASGKRIVSREIPRKIETNFTGYATTIELPLSGMSEWSAAEKASFLKNPFVYIEHSDNTTEFKSAIIVYQDAVPVAVSFEINKFSRFQLVGFADQAASDGGSGNGPIVIKPEAEVILNGTKIPGVVTVVKTTNGNDATAKISLDNEKVGSELDKAGEASNVIISYPHSGENVELSLNAELLSRMANKGTTVVIETQDFSYTLPASGVNLGAIRNTLGSSAALKDIAVQIKLSRVDSTALEQYRKLIKDNGAELVGVPVEVKLTFTFNGKETDAGKLGQYGKLRIKLPGNGGNKPITTGIYMDRHDKMAHTPTYVEVVDGVYYATVNSFYDGVFPLIYNVVEMGDVEGHWSKTHVNDAASRLVVNGTGGDLFTPGRQVSRAEFAAMLTRALGLKHEEGLPAFDDVASNRWYYEGVSTASAYGLIEGYGDGSFRPEASITREQAMVMIARAMRLAGFTLAEETAGTEALLAPFADMQLLSNWAKQAAGETVQAGIVSGRSDNRLAPKEEITRAEAAAMARRLLIQAGLIEA